MRNQNELQRRSGFTLDLEELILGMDRGEPELVPPRLLRFRAGAFRGSDCLTTTPAVMRPMPAVMGGWAAANFPSDEACVRRQQVPIRALARGSFSRRHIESFAHLFDEW